MSTPPPLTSWWFLWSSVASLLLIPIADGKVPLPQLGCPTYSSLSEAEGNCQGTFLMWGEYENKTSSSGNERSSRIDAGNTTIRANFGPYSCSTCNSSAPFGYICPDYQCPNHHISYDFDREVKEFEHIFNEADPDAPECPSFNREYGMAPSCIEIQVFCEENGFGWMIHATSLDGYSGKYECAGCTIGAVEADLYKDTDPDDQLLAPAMLILYATVVFIFLAALVADVKTFRKHFKQEGRTIQTLGLTYEETRAMERKIMRKWCNNLVLHNLGATDENGKPTKLWGQLFKNYACSCGSRNGRIVFATAFFLSWAVAIMAGGGKATYGVPKCLFDGQGEQKGDTYFYDEFDAPIEDAYDYQFFLHNFAHAETKLEENTMVFDWVWFMPEIVALVYLFSVSSLAKSAERIGHESWIVRVYVGSLVACASFAAALSIVSWDHWETEHLFESWAVGTAFMLVFLGPLCAYLAWIFARLLVACGILEFPEVEERSPPTQNIAESPVVHVQTATDFAVPMATVVHIKCDIPSATNARVVSDNPCPDNLCPDLDTGGPGETMI